MRFYCPLYCVVGLCTRRDTYQVRSPDGELVAEVADDLVDASIGSQGDEVLRWREIEIELGPAGTSEDLGRLEKLLTAAGATRSDGSR